MMLVREGAFAMGGNRSPDQQPIHQVYLDTYYMDKYEVTNALYRACVDSGDCTPPQRAISSTYDNFPVTDVDWNQAQAYCEWRGGSLPTEAQWEKAARGTNGRVYPWGINLMAVGLIFVTGTVWLIGNTLKVTMVTLVQPLLAVTKAEKAHMVFTIWQATYQNG